jgi:hypothetical protein
MKDAEVYWSESDIDAPKRDTSHWLGEGRWSSSETWAQIGIKHYQMFKKLVTMGSGRNSLQRMVEWGPGGGANVTEFLKNSFKTCYGVDISRSNLNECCRQVEARRLNGFVPVCISIESPQAALQLIQEPVDFFLSTAVFQHFPSKDYGRAIIDIASRTLAMHGLALIQIRYDNGRSAYRPKRRNYHDHVITFTSYAIDEFWHIAADHYLSPRSVLLEPDNNYAYYFLEKS